MSLGPNDVAQFTYLLKRVQELNFYDTRTDLPSAYSEFTKEGPTDQGADYRSSTSVGLGQWGQTSEFGQFHKDAYEPGQERVSNWYKITNGVLVSDLLLLYAARNQRVKDDKAGMFKDINKQFKDTYHWTVESICTLFQTAARTTTASGFWPGTGRDLLALASASHTSIKSPVVTNNNAQGAMPLSELAIAEAISMMRNMVDDAGRPQGFITEVLVVVGPYWQHRMAQIDSAEKQLDVMNNNPNVLKAGKKQYRTTIDYMINPYLANNDTSWMVIDKKYHRLMFFESLAPQLDTKEKDVSTGATIFKAMAIVGIDHLSYRGYVQSAGA